MKKILFFLLLLVVYPNLVNAQITKRYESMNDRNIFYSETSTPFNESLVLKYSFNYDQKKNYIAKDSCDENFSFEIKLDPVNKREKIEEFIVERKYFTYTIENYCTDRKGYFSVALNSRNYVFGNGRFSVYGDNDSGYGISEHYDHVSSGPQFTILYSSSLSDTGPSFGKDLLYAIKNNLLVSMKVPYTNSYGETEPKYFTFWITKETLAEWAELIQKQQLENKNTILNKPY